MNVLSLNVRGMGVDAKIQWIYRLKSKHKLNVIGIQETWMNDVSKIDARGCWGSTNFDCEGVGSYGRSGGIICIWDGDIFSKINVLKSRHYLIVVGRWKGISENVVFANIYAPQAQGEKNALWEELIQIKANLNGLWVMFGDFNAVRRPEERLNSHFCPKSAFEFNEFIQRSGLIDFNMGGHKFTYFCQAGAKLSKLDRFLVCPNLTLLFPLAKVTAHNRELSDHCPVTLTTSFVDYGPPPFRLFNSWIVTEGFELVIKKTWGDFIGYGTPDLYLAAKFRAVKNAIKRWRQQVVANENLDCDNYRRTIERLDRLAEDHGLSESEVKERNTAMQKLMEGEKRKSMDLKQKARIKWMVDGDENTKFFHGVINAKNRKQRINGLLINGRWSEDVAEVKNEVFRFFSEKFKEKTPIRPKFTSSLFRSISSQTAQELESVISLEEVKSAVWNCGSERAPGPDGFTFKFLKTFWDIISGDVMKFIRHFEEHGHLGRGCNSSFFTLVPKIKDPNTLGDYRPISVIGSMYKIIAKILAARMKKVIGEVVGEVQSAYVEGRNILDGPLIMNEIYAWAKRSKKEVLMFKVDFDKAFDSINWDYLDSVLMQMGFGIKWRRWISGCLTSARASVIVNGSPTYEFEMTKGVRQGDPLSPFLFIIAMEGLNVALQSAGEQNIFKGIQLPNNGL